MAAVGGLFSLDMSEYYFTRWEAGDDISQRETPIFTRSNQSLNYIINKSIEKGYYVEFIVDRYMIISDNLTLPIYIW